MTAIKSTSAARRGNKTAYFQPGYTGTKNNSVQPSFETVQFQLRSSTNVRLTESSVYNNVLKGPPKWGFGAILGVGVKIFGGKVHPSAELRVLRHIWSRSDAPCSSILHGYSHLP